MLEGNGREGEEGAPALLGDQFHASIRRSPVPLPTRRGPGSPVRTVAASSQELGQGRDCGAPRWLRVGAEPGAGTGHQRALPGPPPHHGPAIGAPTPSRRAFLSLRAKALCCPKPVDSDLDPPPATWVRD